MSPPDFSYEASLSLETKAPIRRKKAMIEKSTRPEWVSLIEDLVIGAGFSYSRIAYRIDVAPSTIQKLATYPNRKPRLKVLHALIALHQKVFTGQYATPKARAYWAKKRL